MAAEEMAALYRAQQKILGVLKAAPVILGNEGLNFFLDSFKNEGFLGDGGMERWPPRKKWDKWRRKAVARGGRKLLIDSGRLRRSVRIIDTEPLKVVYGSDVPYARAHNEGLRATQTYVVQAHTRVVGKGFKQKTVHVASHVRQVKQKLPKRQFMGNSTYLNKRLGRIIEAEFIRTLKTM